MGNKFSADTLSFKAEDGHRYWVCFSCQDFHRGSKKRCFLGRLNGTGPHSGAKAVVKSMLKGPADPQAWESEVRKARTARRLAKTFLERCPDTGARIDVLLPSLVVLDTVSLVGDLMDHQSHVRTLQEDETVSVESYLPGTVLRFSPGGASYDVLEAFSHFTWHVTGGDHVVCDLQGVRDGGRYRVTDPTVHSVQGEFGLDDQGAEGINTFFKLHQCTDFCRGWPRPVPLSPPPPPTPPMATPPTTPPTTPPATSQSESSSALRSTPGVPEAEGHHPNGNEAALGASVRQNSAPATGERTQEGRTNERSRTRSGQSESRLQADSQSSSSSRRHGDEEDGSSAAAAAMASPPSRRSRSGTNPQDPSPPPNYDDSQSESRPNSLPTFYLEGGAPPGQYPQTPPPPYEDDRVGVQTKHALNSESEPEVSASDPNDSLSSLTSGGPTASRQSRQDSSNTAAGGRGASELGGGSDPRSVGRGSGTNVTANQTERGGGTAGHHHDTRTSDAPRPPDLQSTQPVDIPGSGRRHPQSQTTTAANTTPPPSFEQALWLGWAGSSQQQQQQQQQQHGHRRQGLSLAPSQSVTFTEELLHAKTVASSTERRRRLASWPPPHSGPPAVHYEEESHYATITACQNIVPLRHRRLQLMDVHHAIAVRERRRRGQKSGSGTTPALTELWRGRGQDGEGHAPQISRPRPPEDPFSGPHPEPSAPPLSAEEEGVDVT